MISNPQITIIGAGPVGLLSAITLVKSGIKIRVFEKEKERSKFSKALVIHSGTLEFLEITHPDLLQKLLTSGKKIREMEIGEKYRINLSNIPSKYNFILVIGQQETERVLEDYLNSIGGKVERGFELTNAKDDHKKVTAFITNNSEKFEVTSDYLIDCSGAHSVIRKHVLNLSFCGEKYLGRIVMGDVKVKNLSRDIGRMRSTNGNIAAFIPLDDEGFFRVILNPHNNSEIPQEITISYFTKLAKNIAPQIELSEEHRWLTSFEISKRMVEKLRVGRIFLAGDAAHIHSPVGGQGMNLGMHDALNLCFKFKRVLIDKENIALLDAYEKERMPIIKSVLRNTDKATRLGIESSFLSEIILLMIRKVFAPIFFHSSFLQKKLLILMSQLKAARLEIKHLKQTN